MENKNNIIEYSPKRVKQIRSDYDREHAKARKLPICMEQIKGDELVNSGFTANELLTLGKTIRESLGADYNVVNVTYGDLYKPFHGTSYVRYAIVNKALFKRSKATWNKEFKTFCYGKTPVIIPVFPNVKGGYYSCDGYIFLTFHKTSNHNTILYMSSDIETCKFKGKYKRHWEKIGHLYMISDILFDKYLESIKTGINNVKSFFDKFK